MNKKIALMALALSTALVSCDKCEEQKWYADNDGDGFGNPAISVDDCDQPEGYVANADDPDDSNASINPNSMWTGPTITFTKGEGVDFTLEENQDRITENVWITRGNNQGLYNIKTEGSYEDFVSPADTEWALGSFDNISELTFVPWEMTTNSTPPDMVGQNMVVHLISDNIYIEIKITSWSSGGSGGQGGFTYERSTQN